MSQHPQATKKGSRFIYELRSVNLQNLPETERAAVLDRFAGFINSLAEPLTIRVVRDRRTVPALGAVYEGPYTRFFIEAASQIDGLVSSLGTKFVRVPTMPEVEVGHVAPKYIIDHEQQFVQVYNITKLGGAMPPAFLTDLYPFVHSVSIEIVPVNAYNSKKLALKHSRSVGNRLVLRQMEGRSLDPEEQAEYERADSAAKTIARGLERLFKVRTKIVLREKTYEELMAAERTLKQVLGGVVGEIDSPKYFQEPLLTGKGPEYARGRWFYTTTSGAVLFFPFAGLDVMDPTGVLLGKNLQTENTIIYDLFEKENYNIGVLGSTGFGKSTLIKSYLARMASAYPDMMVFLFDSIVRPEYAVSPDGKYETSFAGLTGCRVHRFTKDQGAGLDPFAVFPDKRRAANFLASVTKIEGEPNLVASLYLASERSVSVEELPLRIEEMVREAPTQKDKDDLVELKKRLQANLAPYRFLFEGGIDIYPRMVFVLYDVPPGELRDAAAFLALSAIWKFIQEKVPVAMKKAVVIDEGWSLVETNPRTGKPYFPLAVEYVPEIARTGRHYNTAFVIATQLVSDFLGRGDIYGPGRAMIESCATKIVLHQDRAAELVLGEAFDFSASESRFVVNAKIGQGLLVTQEGHILFYNELSDTELKHFTTRPKEVTA